MNYTIISGTNRPVSNSLIISKHYKSVFKEIGIECKLIDLQDLPADFTSSNMYGKRTDKFQQIQDVITSTDKFIFVIPEYNGSFPGVLKAFIDSCSFPESFADKKCALTGLSAGKFGNLRGVSHFSGIANYIKMDVYHNKIYLPAVMNSLNETGEITSVEDIPRIKEQVEGFINF